MRTRYLLNLVTLLAAILGAVDSTFLTLEHFKPELADYCSSSGCGVLVNGDYGHVGPIPVAVFGLSMYLALIALCVLRHRSLVGIMRADLVDAVAPAANQAVPAGVSGSATQVAAPVAEAPEQPQRSAGMRAGLGRLDVAMLALTGLGFGISWWLQWVSLFVVVAFCPFCFTSAILESVIFLLVVRDCIATYVEVTGEVKMLVAITSFVALMLTLTAAPRLWQQINKAHTIQRGPAVGPVGGVVRVDPSLLMAPGAPEEGSPGAKVTIVEFADYQCPACKKAGNEIRTFMTTHGNSCRFIFRNFPIPKHQWGMPAAQAALAAGAQGKFWQMHDYLYDHQDDMSARTFKASSFETFAGAVGLNVDQFKHDMASDVYRKQAESDRNAALQAGVRNTPTFFVIRADRTVVQAIGVTQLQHELSQLNVGN
jgi:protein-disulfide isomerase/uncharacterized membrane protein